MLIHKRTMGVLDLYWTGEYRTAPDGTAEPVMSEFTFASTGFSQEEWWEVPRGSALGRKLRRMYPFCTPVTGSDGTLLDAMTWPKSPQTPETRTKPGEPGKTRRQRRRKTGLLENLLKE